MEKKIIKRVIGNDNDSHGPIMMLKNNNQSPDVTIMGGEIGNERVKWIINDRGCHFFI